MKSSVTRQASHVTRHTSHVISRLTHDASRLTFDVVLAVVVALLAFALYLRMLAPGVLGGDSGEFQFAAWLGGFAHPTGYPLYLLMGWLWTHVVPLGDPAWRMNLLSAIWGAAAVGMFYLLAVQLLLSCVAPQRTNISWRSTVGGRLSAFFAAALFATTPTFWSQAVIAEVYTLNAALLVALLFALVRWAATGRMFWLYAAALVFGLGLAHHRTTLLWLPAIALFGWLVARRRKGVDAAPPSLPGLLASRAAGKGAGGVGAVFRTDVTCGAAAPGRMKIHRREAEAAEHSDFLCVLCASAVNFRTDAPAAAGATADEKSRGARPCAPTAYFVVALLVGLPLLLYAYIPLAAPRTPYLHVTVGPDQTLELYTPTVGGFLDYVTGRTFESEFRSLGEAAGRALPDARRLAAELTWPGIALGLIGLGWLMWRSRPLLALTGGGFVVLFVFNLFYGIGDIAVYYIPLYLIWSLWIAAGAAALSALLAERFVRPAGGRRAWWLPCLLLSVLPGIMAAHLFISNYARIDQSHNHQARVTWQGILAREIPSNAILVTNDRDEMMPLWYMQYVEGVRSDVTGLFPLIRPEDDWADVGATTASALRSGRPVLLIKEMPGLEVKFRLEPAGNGLVRVIGPAAGRAPERPAAARFGDAIELIGYDSESALLSPAAAMTVRLYWRPLRRLERDYTTFVHLVNAEGRVIGASDHRPGGVYYPTSLWKPGETLVDAHTFTVAADPGRPPYAVEVGLYTAEPTLRHLAAPQRIGMIGRERPADRLPDGVARRPDAVFGGQIALRGFETALTGDRLTIRFYWQAVAAASADYTVFVHLLDAGGKIVAQYDGQPARGEFPTRAWPVGHLLADVVSLDLPAALPAGAYRLVAGLYDATTGVRLVLPGATDNSLLLDEIRW